MTLYLLIGILLFLYMNVWFLASVSLKRNDIADIAWGVGFVFLAWSACIYTDKWDARSLIVCVCVTIWGLRLAWHIGKRSWGKPEDFRYLAWRKAWGKWVFVRAYFQVFMLQGFFLYVIIFPVLYVLNAPSAPLGWIEGVGVVIWWVGFLFEAVADAQLADFVRNPINKGQLIQSGLWKYSRHPNYFGEVLLWWGIWFFALAIAGGWMTFFGPLTLTILILFVSGIPMLEKKYEGRIDFEDYKKRTSVFIPLPPKE